MKINPETYYVWIGGSCDYAHKERASAGACIIEQGGKAIDTWTCSALSSTEFRMLLTLMIHTMETLPEGSDILFMTNVAYCQNFDKAPTEKSANPDLIAECIRQKARHKSVGVKIVSYHKYPQLPQTHQMAREVMVEVRDKGHENRE